MMFEAVEESGLAGGDFAMIRAGRMIAPGAFALAKLPRFAAKFPGFEFGAHFC